jgi:hypothetical protein
MMMKSSMLKKVLVLGKFLVKNFVTNNVPEDRIRAPSTLKVFLLI